MIAPDPPRLSQVAAGARLVAGLGFATIHPSCDFETYSEAGFVWNEERQRWDCLPGASQDRKGIFIVGAAVYAQHPTAEVICFAYDLRDGLGKRHWRPGLPNPTDLFHYVRGGGVLSAWNAAFEFWIWTYVCVRLYGWPPVELTSFVDPMAKGRAFTMPGKLSDISKVLGLRGKDAEGDRLIKKFTIPQNPKKTDPRRRYRCLWTMEEVEQELARRMPVGIKLTPAAERKIRASVMSDHVDTLKFGRYNDQDIEAEAEAASLIPDMNEVETRYWRNDQTINNRGVQIDIDSVDACIAIINQATTRYEAELEALAGCKPTELEQLKFWLHGYGVHVDSLDEENIDFLIEKDDKAKALGLPPTLPPQCRRALEIRQLVGSASVKKVFAMRNQVTVAGRLHDLYTWAGARTGRPTGNGPQPTNLPKAGPDVHRCGWRAGKVTDPNGCGRHHGGHLYACPWCGTVRAPDKPAEWSPQAAEDALLVIKSKSLLLVQLFFGDAMLTIAGVLRALFIAKRGHELVSSDFSAIEGVVIAALAGEEWRLEVFRTHGKIYEASASKSLKIPFENFAKYKEENDGRHHPARGIGKFQELACGFGGWINGWKAFGGPGTDDEIKENILAWRDASPSIVELWGGQQRRERVNGRWVWKKEFFGLEGAAVQAILNPGQIYSYRGIKYLVHADVLYCRLLSGRRIPYHRPRLSQSTEDWRGLSISFEGWNSNPKNGAMGWQRMDTYGARLAENVVQATARDIQMHAIENLELRGYPIVLHTYDEVVAEVPVMWGSVEELEGIMGTLPEWANGWPIKAAGGWRGDRYRKA